MINRLYNYFENIIGNDVTKDEKSLDVYLAGMFGTIELVCNFKDNEYKVSLSVDEDEFRRIYMIDDEDDIDINDLNEFNYSYTYNNIVSALNKSQEALDLLINETSGSDVFNDYDDYGELFSNAIKIVKDK